MLVHVLKPFSFIELNAICRHCKHDLIITMTLMKSIHRLKRHVLQKIAHALPSTFAIVFDGCTVLSSHYLGVFATFPSKNKCGYNSFLISFSPFADENNLSAAEQKRFLEFVLSKYPPHYSNLASLIGNIWAVNKCLAHMTGKPLIGCQSYRFNLVLQYILNKYEELINEVNKIKSSWRGSF